nr:hypothetical protein [uncultured Lacibacter sp.]
MNTALGYSESQLSRVLDVLFANEQPEQVCVVQNVAVKEEFPFADPALQVKILPAATWQAATDDRFVFGVARPFIKKAVFDYFLTEKNIHAGLYRNLVARSSVLSSTVQTGNGLFVEPLSVITSFTRVGFGVTVNRHVSIGHHCSIGDFVTINPGVHIAGHCTIGNAVQIGIGSVVFDHISIGEGSIIGGGSVVTKDIPAGVKAWGNPCKVMGTV